MAEEKKPEVIEPTPVPRGDGQAPSATLIALSQTNVQNNLYPGRSTVPDAELAERYEKLAPGSVSRFMTMAEQQGEHRRGLEVRFVQAEIHESNARIESDRRAQWFAFILAFVLLAAGLGLIWHGLNVDKWVIQAMGFATVMADVVGVAIGLKGRGASAAPAEPTKKPE